MMLNNKNFIKAELKRARITQRHLAEILGVSPVSIHHVVTGSRKSSRIRAVIALAINRPVADIWPEEAEKRQNKTRPRATGA